MDGKGGEGGREWSQTKSLVDNGGKLFLGSQNGPTIKPFAVLQQITAEPTSPVGWQAANPFGESSFSRWTDMQTTRHVHFH